MSPRDTWEEWISSFEDIEKDCDRAFMCLVVILMSSSTSDKQLGELVPRLFLSGITSANGVIEIVQKYGVDSFCSLLAEGGRYYQNAERILNAADYFVQKHNGKVPSTIPINELCTLLGVGYKTANIVVTMAFRRMDGIPSDIHVLRWANLLGWTSTKTDGLQCSKSIEHWLPVQWWPFVNPVFGSFGQLLTSSRRKEVLRLVHKCTDTKVGRLFDKACKIYR
jgi:endonuclease III